MENTLTKKEFLKKTSELVKKPKKIFLGMGDFLEIGDYNNLIDAILLNNYFARFEAVLDKNNRKISESGDIPFSFFKLGVYFPEFIFKDLHVDCISTIGKKGRLFPGAKEFIDLIKEFNPLVFTAVPFELSIEYLKRLGLSQENLFSTEYAKKDDDKNIFSGTMDRFVSGDLRIKKIEQEMKEFNYAPEDILYIGRSEAGSATFASLNSIAFNPPGSIMERSKLNIYGSTLESLAVLLNFNSTIEEKVLSEDFDQSFPSLVVYSLVQEKSPDLLKIEFEHRQMQENIIGMKIEHSQDSYASLEREINVMLGASNVNISKARKVIYSRLEKYLFDSKSLVKDVYNLALERYKKFSIT